jgi:hypothetical protein
MGGHLLTGEQDSLTVNRPEPDWIWYYIRSARARINHTKTPDKIPYIFRQYTRKPRPARKLAN